MGLIRLNKVRLDSGGYDSRGVYWGVGQSLFEYCSYEKDIQGYLRAPDREFAKDYVRKLYPEARFYDDKLSCNICGEPLKPNNHGTCKAQARMEAEDKTK
jgi:hypothetical protein